MEIAILVFFIAIFGGVLFLLGLIWFIFRRVRRSRSSGKNFSLPANLPTGYEPAHRKVTDSGNDSDDNSAAFYAGSSVLANQSSENTGQVENPAQTETAYDSPHESDNSYSHESHGAAAEPNYTESSSSSYDSGSGSDSGSSSSSDSGSGSSDSGSSSSSSE
jgi:hypothetical protein